MTKKKLSHEEKKLTWRTSYQQGFSKEGAALLSKAWITPEPPANFADHTLASFIKSSGEYSSD